MAEQEQKPHTLGDRVCGYMARGEELTKHIEARFGEPEKTTALMLGHIAEGLGVLSITVISCANAIADRLGPPKSPLV